LFFFTGRVFVVVFVVVVVVFFCVVKREGKSRRFKNNGEARV
jgi:hypothetical protein